MDVRWHAVHETGKVVVTIGFGMGEIDSDIARALRPGASNATIVLVLAEALRRQEEFELRKERPSSGRLCDNPDALRRALSFDIYGDGDETA